MNSKKQQQHWLRGQSQENRLRSTSNRFKDVRMPIRYHAQYHKRSNQKLSHKSLASLKVKQIQQSTTQVIKILPETKQDIVLGKQRSTSIQLQQNILQPHNQQNLEQSQIKSEVNGFDTTENQYVDHYFSPQYQQRRNRPKINISFFPKQHFNDVDYNAPKTQLQVFNEQLNVSIYTLHPQEINNASRSPKQITSPLKELCSICLDYVEFPKKCTLEKCSHSYHRKCLGKYLKLKILSRCLPIQCPEPSCEREVEVSDLQILDKKFLEKYHQYTLESFINKNPTLMAWCPTPNCKYAFAFSETDYFFQCLVCRKQYCVLCRVEYHFGKTCEQYRRLNEQKNEKLFYDFLKDRKVKQCPQCKMWVQKREGCNHMTCRCKYQFCYVCGGSYKYCRCENPTIPIDDQYYQPPVRGDIELPPPRPSECEPIQEDKRLNTKAKCCVIF